MSILIFSLVANLLPHPLKTDLNGTRRDLKVLRGTRKGLKGDWIGTQLGLPRDLMGRYKKLGDPKKV